MGSDQPSADDSLTDEDLTDSASFVDQFFTTQSRIAGETDEAADSACSSTTSGTRHTVLPMPPTRDLGDYHIDEPIGAGGMGIVYRATRVSSGQTVAIKMLRSGQRHNTAIKRERFQREIDALAKLDHPNICHLYTCGEFDGQAWYAMEYIDGQSLFDDYADGAPDIATLLPRFIEAARAVGFANRQGIIHRDLNPNNIMIAGDGQAVVMDFGLVRDLSEDLRITIPGKATGTPAFMAPEQVCGDLDAVSPQTDVWGLGASLYFCLTGAFPFLGRRPLDMHKAILEAPTPQLRERRAELPRGLQPIINACLHKQPGHRYASCDALADDLEDLLAGRPLRHARGGRRWIIGGLALVLVLAAATGLLIALR